MYCLLGLCRIHGEEEPPVVEKDQVMELLRNLNPYKPEDPEGGNRCHYNVFIIPIIFERSWRIREVPCDWRKVNVIPVFKKGSNKPQIYRLVSLTWLPGKIMEQILSETASKYMKVKKVTGTSLHGLTKGNPCPTKPVALSNSMTGSVIEGEHWMFSTLTLARLSILLPYSTLVCPSWDVIV